MPRRIKGIIQDYQVPTEMIEFYSWDPPQKSRSAVYDDVNIRGRSEPHVFYSYTEAQVWNFAIYFRASFEQNDGGVPLGVMERQSFIESFVMPDYGQVPGQFAVVRPPHLARIRILKMIDLIGTIRTPNWVFGGSAGTYDVNNGYPHQIDLTFTFHAQQPVGVSPLGYADIRRLSARGQDRFRR